MKISILSMQKVNNFGSLLQGYSLQKMIKSIEDDDVKFIDIEKIDEDYKLLEPTYIKKGLKIKITSILEKINRYIINRAIVKVKMNRQIVEFENFRINFLKIRDRDNEEKYDLCIIGSDEVFNCLTKSKWGFTSQLFGNVRQANNVATYAACCGTTTLDKIPRDVEKKIRTAFTKVSNFSVRDNNTYKFVSNLTDKKINLNLDPVIVGDFSKEIEEFGTKIKLPKRYCIVYSYFNRINKKDDIKMIKEFCKKHNLEIITIGAPQIWNSKFVVMNPFEVLYAFSKAEFVITDTFHGTIFASKYSTRFAVLIRESNKFKLNALLEHLQIKNHNIKNLNELEKVYQQQNDFKNIETIIENERNKTLSYLKEVLNEAKMKGDSKLL